MGARFRDGRTIAIVMLCWSICCGSVVAGEPPSQPMLRLETGMHTAGIERISVDRRGDLLLTVSADKTARLWSLGSGRLIRILRPPVGSTNEGKLLAAALSPDGAVAAVGGWTGSEWDNSFSIYLFETNSGKLMRHLAVSGEVDSLAFSPDGSLLAAGLWRKSGVRVWHSSDWKEAWRDEHYDDTVGGLAFSASNQLVVSSLDGYIRSYNTLGDLRQPKMRVPGGRPLGVAISPDGERIAIGYDNTVRVDLLAGLDLRLLTPPVLTGFSASSVPFVAWSPDGATLFAGSRPPSNTLPSMVRAWSDHGLGPYRDWAVARNSVTGLVPLSNQDLVFGSFEPSWGVLSGSGTVERPHPAATADYRDAGDSFRLSANGMEVWFGFKPLGQQQAAFLLAQRRLVNLPSGYADVKGPVRSSAGMEVANWDFNASPTLNGKKLELYPHEVSRAVAVDSYKLLLGAMFSLRLFNASGAEIWRLPVPGVTRAVNITSDGRLAVAAFGDGTIRWYRMRDGVELLALFPHADGKRWVAWTPQGYYDASVGGDDLIGWHVNRGKDHEADFFPAKQFADQFNRPDIVALVLETLDPTEAVRKANATAGRRAAAAVAALLPPVVEILSPADQSSVVRSPVVITYHVRSQSQVTGVAVLVDGRPVTTDAPKIIMSGADGTVASVSVPVPQSNAVISLIAANAQARGEAAIVHIAWDGDKDWYKPDLRVLAIGVAEYKDKTLTLKYPGKDAEDFAVVTRAQQGGLYNHVEVHQLQNEQATRENIRKELNWLRKTPTRDVAMLFLSGHGQNDAAGHYHYLPYDTDEADLDLTTIQDFEFEDFLAKVPGKVIVFLDTCFGGGVISPKGSAQPDIDRLANRLAAADKGTVVFTSSTGREFSQESDEWKNGAFTKALIEAFKGGADYQKDRRITIAALEVYLSHRVQELTNGKQSPASTKPKTIQDLVIATVVP